MHIKAYALLLVAIVIGVAGQLLLKHGMSRRPGFRLRDLPDLACDFSIFGGFCCYELTGFGIKSAKFIVRNPQLRWVVDKAELERRTNSILFAGIFL